MARTEEEMESQEIGQSLGDSPGLLSRVLPMAASKSRLVIGVASSLALLTAAVWYATSDDGPTPAEQLQQALRLLDDRQDIQSRGMAREIAEQLEAEDYHDPDFAGGVEFVLGIAAFRDAQSMDELSREPQYVLAERYLKAAETRVLPRTRLPEWSLALGTSLHEIGKSSEARPLLEEAVRSYPEGRLDASMRLTDIYLVSKTPADLERALQMSAAVLEMEGVTRRQKNHVYMQRAQVLLALKRNKQAQAEIEKVSDETRDQGTIVFHAQTLMAEQEYKKAIALLEEVADYVGLNPTYPRQASYLIGVCYEALGDIDPAIHWYYEKTAEKYKESHEGLAAYLRAGDLLREKENDEQALQAYQRALSMVRRPEDFRNRWLSLEEFRSIIRNAWNKWVENHQYHWAIALSQLMTPLLPETEAHELTALANRRWAKHLEAALEQAPFSRRGPLEEQLRQRWRESGKAYAQLANTLRTSSRYAEELWHSAEHYRKGHDFESALNQLTRFINTRPKEMMPEALVRRGEVLMDLDQLDDALEHFQRVRESYPTAKVAFEAQYLIGKCHLERDELDEAEKAWREILTSPQLKPIADVWRLSLFSLGRLLHFRAAISSSRAAKLRLAQHTEQAEAELKTAFDQWDESIHRLEEFLGREAFRQRFRDSPESIEARYLLAKSLQHSAEGPRWKLKTAETENARLELRRAMNLVLDQARKEFQKLQMQLLARDETDRLDELGRRILRDCYFEIAHTYYALEQYDKAIIAYSSAANKFPQDPQVLLAYLQMANCYDALGKPDEAPRMLLQAKVILEGMTDEVFQPRLTNMTRKEWDDWLSWARNLYQSGGTVEASGP